MNRTSVAQPRSGCPSLEALAAFAEGRLASKERSAVVAHLADCDACREIVLEARLLIDEETGASAASSGDVIPFRKPRRAARWPFAAAVAAAVALAAVGLVWWQGRDGSTEGALAELAQETDVIARLGDSWSEPLWSVTRGEGPVVSERARAFRLGVRSVDLELALAAGDRRAARRTAAENALLVGDVPLADPIAHLYREIARRAPDPNESAAALAADAAIAARLTQESVEASLWELGRWGETGRLAASAGARVGLPAPPRGPAVPAELAELVRLAARPELGAPFEAQAAAFAALVARGGDLR